MKNDEYGYVKFTGDYSMLKSMGFTFQKLFANNYMQWAKDGFRVWKRGHDITHDRYNLFKLVRFLESHPVVKIRDNGSISFFKFYSDPDQNIYDYYPATEENVKRYRDNMELWSSDKYDKDNPPPYLGDMEHVKVKTLDMLKELKDMGWYELDYYPED